MQTGFSSDCDAYSRLLPWRKTQRFVFVVRDPLQDSKVLLEQLCASIREAVEKTSYTH